MNTERTAKMLDDDRVNVKVKLALLWVALMFFYIYNDLFSLQQPGHLDELMEGELQGVEISQGILLGGAVLMALPSIMVLLSLTLRAQINRMVNIVAGGFHVFVLVGTQFVGEGEVWMYWRLLEFVEAVFLGIIIWTAWTWPTAATERQESPSPADRAHV